MVEDELQYIAFPNNASLSLKLEFLINPYPTKLIAPPFKFNALFPLKLQLSISVFSQLLNMAPPPVISDSFS